MKPADERPTFLIVLRPERGCGEPVLALRRALKLLLRQFGLRCVDLREQPSERRAP